MKKKITLLACLLFLFPALADAQPKAARLLQKMAKNRPVSERAAERTAKGLAKRAAAKSSRITPDDLRRLSRREQDALNQLSDQLGVRVHERVVKQRAKQTHKSQRDQHRQAAAAAARAVQENFRLKEATVNIIERNPDDILAALSQMRKMRLKRGDTANPEYFQQFATVYYKKHLKTLTPHMYEFFGQVGKTHSNSLEKDVILRMRELFSRTDKVLQAVHRGPGGTDKLRLRYLKHVEKLDDRNFNPESLIFSYEQKLTSFSDPVIIRHIHIGSKFYIGRNKVRVAGFDYDISHITELYKYLLNKDGTADGITAVFDPASRQIALYSPDKSVWIRVTPHEYASVNRLHVHLNETRAIEYQDASGQTRAENVMINMSIPIMPSAALNPKNKKPYNLYEKLILDPVRRLQKDPGATVITGPIF